MMIVAFAVLVVFVSIVAVWVLCMVWKQDWWSRIFLLFLFVGTKLVEQDFSFVFGWWKKIGGTGVTIYR